MALMIARNAKAMGMDTESIIKLTGLTSNEIECVMNEPAA